MYELCGADDFYKMTNFGMTNRSIDTICRRCDRTNGFGLINEANIVDEAIKKGTYRHQKMIISSKTCRNDGIAGGKKISVQRNPKKNLMNLPTVIQNIILRYLNQPPRKDVC